MNHLVKTNLDMLPSRIIIAILAIVLASGCGTLQPVNPANGTMRLNHSRMKSVNPPRHLLEEDRIALMEAVNEEDEDSTEAARIEEVAVEETKVSLIRSEIVDKARDYLGVRYKYGGKSPSGFDCSGLTGFVYSSLDLPLKGSSRLQATQGVRLSSVKEAKAGDLLFFSKEKNGRGGVNHVALIVRASKSQLVVIHSTNEGVIEEDIANSSYWSPRILYARDLLKGLR